MRHGSSRLRQQRAGAQNAATKSVSDTGYEALHSPVTIRREGTSRCDAAASGNDSGDRERVGGRGL